jgi:hypothetical protein|tara:strand:+ start:25 stop:210 length:186 start_codon:yes stop_codon:yes gene_type:complete
MEMSIEDYTREQQKCLTNIVKYELKKNPRYLDPLIKLKYYLSTKYANEKDMELIEKYLTII